MMGLKTIRKTREYLDYLEEHLTNVARAWREIQDTCADMAFIRDEKMRRYIDLQVYAHDMSKFMKEEFTQYRESFFPTVNEEEHKPLGDAWDSHKRENPHHWENWTELADRVWEKSAGEMKRQGRQAEHDRIWQPHCVHMIIDWTAMGYKVGDTAQQYYESKKDVIKIPEYAHEFMYEIFNRLQGGQK